VLFRSVIGRVPLFYYVIHIFLFHLIASLLTVFTGGEWTDLVITVERFFSGSLAANGFNLWVVYSVWIAVVIILYPVCKWYNQYKSDNKEKWWLSYI